MFCKLDYFKLGFGKLLTYNLVEDKNRIFFKKFLLQADHPIIHSTQDTAQTYTLHK